MCLNCGCMRAHDDMGKPDVNITYEDLKRAADASGATVDDILQTISRDRRQGPPRAPGRVHRRRRAIRLTDRSIAIASRVGPARGRPDGLVDDGPIENRPTDVTTDGQTYGG